MKLSLPHICMDTLCAHARIAHVCVLCACIFWAHSYACNLQCTLLPYVQGDSYVRMHPYDSICGELYFLYIKAFAYAYDRRGSITKICVLHVHAALASCAQWSGQHDCGMCAAFGAIHELCSICLFISMCIFCHSTHIT